VKIYVDTTLQEVVEDDFRGRVFSVYDTLFNVTFVLALLVGALLLPPSGVSWAMLLVVGIGYLLTAAAFWRLTGVDSLRSRRRIRSTRTPSGDERGHLPAAAGPVAAQPGHRDAEDH
jgi:MFS family permease